MPSLKIYPPTRLPNDDVTETQFCMWKEEMEVYLSQEPDFKIFLPSKAYGEWTCYEENPQRIPSLKNEDRVTATYDVQEGRAISAQEANSINEEKLENVRTNLRTVLSIVGKCVSEGHYNSVIKHSTSLNWIYNMLRCDYDIQNKGVHFFNVLDTKYNPSKYTPIAFYNIYRTVISNNLAKRGDVIKYKNNETLDHDERFSPMLEDLVLLNVIREIDQRLPNVVKNFYFHKMKKEERLMDFKTDILLNIPQFLDQLEAKGDDEATLNAFKQSQSGWKQRNRKVENNRKYCRFCFLARTNRVTYTSHNFGDLTCPSLSAQDKKKLMETAKLSIVKEDAEDHDTDHEELAEMYGYGQYPQDNGYDEVDSNQVLQTLKVTHKTFNPSRSRIHRYGYIQPISSQILTVFFDLKNSIPFHIELDSGATVSYIREDIVRQYNFKILPNTQVSKLGD